MDSGKRGQTRPNGLFLLATLSLVVGVLATSTGMAGNLTRSLSNQIQSSANKLQNAPANVATKAKAKQQMASMPLYFIQNLGQVDTKVSHYLQGAGTSVYFTAEGLTYSLQDKNKTASRSALKLDFVGANKVAPTSVNKSDTTINYFKGGPEQWKTGVPTSSGLKYTNLWPGIDLVYSGTGQKLKYDFHVAPGADPSQINLAYKGATSLSVNDKGQLRVKTPATTLTDDRPYSYQEAGGKKVKVQSSYEVSQGSESSRSYGFSVGDYDRTKPLVIDPATVIKSGFIGGSGSDQASDIALEASGATYVSGTTSSSEATFPDAVGPDTSYNGGDSDAFVVKVNPEGTGLVYASFIGGSGEDFALAVTFDGSGNAYVTGGTASTEASFPVSGGPDLVYNGGDFDAFVAKVNPTGTGLAYAGYLGGSGDEVSRDVAVDPTGSAYMTGDTTSTEATFPVSAGPDVTYNGAAADAFVAKVDSSGSGLTYSGYIGGAANDSATTIAVDANGLAYVGGVTGSTQATFPVAGGPDLTHNGGYDVFVSKLNPSGTGFVYSGYIGGAVNDFSGRLVIDGSGAVYITGHTGSGQATFPALVGPNLFHNGRTDAFISKVHPSGGSLTHSGFIGGTGGEQGVDVAVTGAGIFVAGNTSNSTATSFPNIGGPDLTHNGGVDSFLARVKVDGTGFIASGWVGGGGNDYARGVAATPLGTAYIAGQTSSTEASFPVLGGPDLTANGGLGDAFITRVVAGGPRQRAHTDINGNLKTDVGVYRTDSGIWYLRGYDEIAWGGDPSDKAVPADYDGNAAADVAVYRGATGTWYVKDQAEVSWGGDSTDIPVPADYSGDGLIAEKAVYRKNTGTWYIQGGATIQWGGDPSDIPVPGDYTGDGTADAAVYRKDTGTWYLNGIGAFQWGGDPSDIPVPGDYDNSGTTDMAVYRRSTGTWWVMGGVEGLAWGGDSTDVPVPGDYNKDGQTDFAVYRKSTGYWYVRNQFEVSWGGHPSDKALPLPHAIREGT